MIIGHGLDANDPCKPVQKFSSEHHRYQIGREEPVFAEPDEPLPLLPPPTPLLPPGRINGIGVETPTPSV